MLCLLIFPMIAHSQAYLKYDHEVPLSIADRPVQLPWVGGLNAVQYNTLDMNGDGHEELLLFDRTDERYLVFEQTDDGHRFLPGAERLLPELPAGWLVLRDYDGDGKKDIFSNGPRGVVVYKNTGESSQNPAWQLVANPLRTMGFSGLINLIVNASDIPAIADVDGDGDLDIVVYDFAIGGYMRYNKNMSRERYGHADSLEYEITTRTWGEFAECDCNAFAFDGATCADIGGGRVAHAGGKALLLLDDDGDGDLDLLAGHEQCEELYFFRNNGDSYHAVMTTYSAEYPNATQPANFFLFPAGFYLDVNGDEVEDLLVSPNVSTNIDDRIDFRHSNWLYTNMGTTDNPDFRYQRNDFLQNEMLDLGDNAMPALADVDADGDLDVIAAADGLAADDRLLGRLALLTNTGTASTPAFSFTDDDFLDLSALNLTDPTVAIADLDGDEALDLFVTGEVYGTRNVQAFWLRNTALSGSPMAFAAPEVLPLSLLPGAVPVFSDVDEDGVQDMLVGQPDGALHLYKGMASAAPSFTLQDDEYLGLGRDFSLERLKLAVVPGDVDGDGREDLLITDGRGLLHVYNDFKRLSNTKPEPELVLEEGEGDSIDTIFIGTNGRPAAGDLYGKGSASLVLGTARGGLMLLKNNATGEGSGNAGHLVLRIWPNPVYHGNAINIRTSRAADLVIYNMLGQAVTKSIALKSSEDNTLNLAHLRAGMYVMHFTTADGSAAAERFLQLP